MECGGSFSDETTLSVPYCGGYMEVGENTEAIVFIRFFWRGVDKANGV
jgi:hypothetical protein